MTEIVFLQHFTPPRESEAEAEETIEPEETLEPEEILDWEGVIEPVETQSWHEAREGVITIGNFDGVHLGHAVLLREVRRLADELGGPAVAVVLDPHPATILRPEQAPERLTWIEERAERMEPCGIDLLVVCPTTREFLRMTADEFYQWLVVDHLAARAIVEGPNFFFGRGRSGDADTLIRLSHDHDVKLRIVDASEVDGRMISSTRIRQLLETGEVERAAELLGRPHRIRGKVAQGAKRGRTIGFPTANLTEVDVVLPAPGVYGGIASLEGETCQAAIHIGPNPTFDTDETAKVEVHLLDYTGNLYDRAMKVDFLLKVREIARFDSADRLVEQLQRDIDAIRSELPRFRSS